MKQYIKSQLPKKYVVLISKFHARFIRKYKKSYSQCGEDMILDLIFRGKKTGTYVDVGANNPIIQSNTNYLYQKGWSGINIDALPGSMKSFKKLRRRDVNLEIPISDEDSTLKYYMFQPSFFNSFLEESAILFKEKLIGSIELKTEKLSLVLDRHLNNKEIDFITVDVEGLDLQVLRSNDWTKYRPKVILMELFANDIESIKASEINIFLNANRYSFYCNTPTNIFYIENEFYKVRFNT